MYRGVYHTSDIQAHASNSRSAAVAYRLTSKSQAAKRRQQRGSVTVKSGVSVVTDKSVPEGHKGLHGFLYGEEGAEAHEEKGSASDHEDSSLEGHRVTVETYIAKRLGTKKAGVYAILGEDMNYQYIGYARDVLASIKVHRAALGESRCSLVETRFLPPQTVASRKSLQAEAESWIGELQTIPPGNSMETHLWETKVVADVETFEEKKLKMQKAMGEVLEPIGSDATAEQRRQNLISAVAGDDWSSVIDAQTQETIGEGLQQASTEPNSSNSPVESPFETRPYPEDFARKAPSRPMTIENVDRVLDSVRPILIADGGNVEVVEVGDGVVALRLQGACGTCASSAGTMKMGIERALKEAFGDALIEVKQVDIKESSASVTAINAHLDMLRPAIKSYGGSVEVKKIDDGVCHIDYSGPPTIGSGIVAAIKNQFPDVTEVKFC